MLTDHDDGRTTDTWLYFKLTYEPNIVHKRFGVWFEIYTSFFLIPRFFVKTWTFVEMILVVTLLQIYSFNK